MSVQRQTYSRQVAGGSTKEEKSQTSNPNSQVKEENDEPPTRRNDYCMNGSFLQAIGLGNRGESDMFDCVTDGNKPVKEEKEDELCQHCLNINWSIMGELMNFTGRFMWIGKPIDDVGEHYRRVKADSKCPLCRQLRATWITKFIRERHPNRKDPGDRIHIFRHLRHLPQVSDFPTSTQVLRENKTPFHIAVVPILRGWRQEIRTHVATRGLVVVKPRVMTESKIFVNQPVAEKFDTEVVEPWMKFCKRQHRVHCHPQEPDVEGLKLIDCESEDFVIRRYRPQDKYVCLSYVWGKEGTETSPVPIKKKRKRKMEDDKRRVKSKSPRVRNNTSRALTLTTGNEMRIARLDREKETYNPPTRQPVPKHILDLAAKAWLPITADSYIINEPVQKLPKDLPLTIKDAIKVTKSFGYRYLWVDKYCINQKNKAEMQLQFSRMGDIYAGSQLTIFALGENSDSGLPGVSTTERNYRRQCTAIGDYQFVTTMPDPHLCIKQSDWSSRAWTYQEGLFSTRRLFFTNFEVYFECNAMNAMESFKSNLRTLHTRNGERLRAWHRAGRFVCGNSNSYSHVKVSGNRTCHRKIDIIRRCQLQIRQYTKRQLTDPKDELNAFSGIARFYARSTARIASLAGVPVPFPIAMLPHIEKEGIDHLAYALAWTHRVHTFCEPELACLYPKMQYRLRAMPWEPYENPLPQRRRGFPSWSWAGWFGEVALRRDFPYCWTGLLSSVKLGFRNDAPREYSWLQDFGQYSDQMIAMLLNTTELQFDAYVLDPERLEFWDRSGSSLEYRSPSTAMRVNMSTGPTSFEDFRMRLLDGTYECVVLGTHGEPRRAIMRAMRGRDKKSHKARNHRIDLFKIVEREGVVCLVVKTVKGVSQRMGVLKVDFQGWGRRAALREWTFKDKKSFVLV
ncbi:heterokaryon incompatibility protein-domain-containing protein [Stachybotrys elegans]|uniref:Heterokaryon incompatibility protein-domain-containing protein n=1 Tax=Stachybotrys elegans TaxID=80388 RepID=A0A8K0WU26_9HYPO|nr:heterokaryon incompatibility protein-domain-containing protein [Stachybotrys elegans]